MKSIPFHVCQIDDEEIAAVSEVLRSGWLTTGAKTREFEARFAARVGARFAIAVNSCTAALHLALEAIGIKPGDEVIVPTMTFAATAEVVAYFQATPVLVDSDPRTLNIDPVRVEEVISTRTKAIIPVHFAGQPCDMAALTAMSRRNGIRIIEDSAHAFPAEYNGKSVGSLGDIGCFSFYTTKTITTGEGGMAVTDNPEWADRMRIMSLHGISRDAWRRYSAEGTWSYEIIDAGFKYNMTDIAAAIGLKQLDKASAFLEARRRIAINYTRQLADIKGLELPTSHTDRTHSWHLFPIRLPLERMTINRGEFIDLLKQAGISTSVHFIPLHRHPYYQKRYGYGSRDFPIATNAFERIVSLPIYPSLTDSDIAEICKTIHMTISAHTR